LPTDVDKSGQSQTGDTDVRPPGRAAAVSASAAPAADVTRRQVLASGRRLVYVVPAVLAVGSALDTPDAFAISAPGETPAGPGRTGDDRSPLARSKAPRAPAESAGDSRKPESQPGGAAPSGSAGGTTPAGGSSAAPPTGNESGPRAPVAERPSDGPRPAVTLLPRAGVGGPYVAADGP
jgi:hypothetical protein